MEIRILAQITLDGYVAKTDGKRNWYLNPAVYGIDDFFNNASAILDYDESKYRIEFKNEEVFLTDDLKIALSRLKNLAGYTAIEATPQSLSLISALMSYRLVSKLQLIYLPVCLGSGVSLFHSLSDKSEWTLSEIKCINDSLMITYKMKS